MRFDRHEKAELTFPVTCPYRIIASDEPEVVSQLQTRLKAMGVANTLTRGNMSRQGKYVSYQIEITLKSRIMMQEIDQTLRSIEGVKMVL